MGTRLLLGVRSVLELNNCDGYTTCEYTTELYTLKGQIVWNMNFKEQ